MSISQVLPSLPSLNALRAFDALARTGSVTSAARALSVTQGAVSHQISQLEEWFGKSLVRRDGRGIVLTEIGRELSESTRDSFERLAKACESVSRVRTPELHLAATGSFLALWLIPRLEQLEFALAGIRLRLRTDGGFEDLASERIDALVACDAPPWPPGIAVIELEAERIGPVCTGKWRKGASQPDWASTVPRLSTEARADAWREWARAEGLPSPRGKARTFDHLTPLLEAAKAGLGVAMVPELIASQHLVEGSLLAPRGFVESGRSFVLAHRAGDSERTEVAELARWFSNQAPENLRRSGGGTSRRG